jgi:hypothetical protein
MYAHELARPRVARKTAQAAAKTLARIPLQDAVVCSFIDDYGSKLEVEREEAAETLIWYADQENIPIDFVGFEADSDLVSDRLLEQAGIENGELVRTTNGSHTVVTVKTEEYTACPTLSAVWALAKLGEPEFMHAHDLYTEKGAARGYDGFAAPRLLTVLPVKYMRTEVTVYDLLRAAGHNPGERLGYAFY